MNKQTRRRPAPTAVAADGEKPTEYRLSATQQTTARTLGEEIRRIIDEGNRRVNELEEALQELAGGYAAQFGAQGVATFVATDGGRRIVLVVKPETEPPSEAKAE